MKTNILLGLFITTIMLGGCAAAPKDTEYRELAKSKDLACEHSAKTGSHLKKKKCMSKELADEIRRRNQQALRSQESKGQTSAGSH